MGAASRGKPAGAGGAGQGAVQFDVERRYVRVSAHRPDGFVEFEFAIGDPALCVELLLPAAAFHEFCLAHDVIPLEPLADAATDWVARRNAATRWESGELGREPEGALSGKAV